MRILTPLLFAAVLPGAAFAQSFEGPSIGAQVGYGTVDTDGPSLEGDDALLGLRAYYDVDLGGFLAGGGIQYDAADIDLDGAASIDSVFRLGARAGADVGGAYLYGTGGYAQVTTEDGTASAGDSNGYFVGVGAEAFVAENITVGGELLYHRFEEFDIDTLEADATTVGVNVNFRF